MGFDDFGRQATKNNRKLQNNLRRDFKTKRFISPSFTPLIDQATREEIKLKEEKFKNIEKETQKETLIELTLMFIVGFIFLFIWYI